MPRDTHIADYPLPDPVLYKYQTILVISDGTIHQSDGTAWNAIFPLTEAIAEARRAITVSANYTVLAKDYLVLVDATTGPITITLPSTANMKRKTVIVKKIDSSLNAVTIQRSGTDLIEGGTTLSLPLINNAVILVSDGVANWYKASTV